MRRSINIVQLAGKIVDIDDSKVNKLVLTLFIETEEKSICGVIVRGQIASLLLQQNVNIDDYALIDAHISSYKRILRNHNIKKEQLIVADYVDLLKKAQSFDEKHVPYTDNHEHYIINLNDVDYMIDALNPEETKNE